MKGTCVERATEPSEDGATVVSFESVASCSEACSSEQMEREKLE
jgi:hypothetical protein